jgi:hypothetical protein
MKSCTNQRLSVLAKRYPNDNDLGAVIRNIANKPSDSKAKRAALRDLGGKNLVKNNREILEFLNELNIIEEPVLTN